MSDDVNNQNAGAAAATTTNNGSNTTGGTDPIKTGQGASGSGFDTKTIQDQDFEKVFDDPRLWNHPRFKGLNEQATKAKQLEAEKLEAEKTRLASEKKFQELAELNKQEADKWKSQAETASVNNTIQMEASKAGVVDVDAAIKLLDRSGIKLNEDGTVSGVAEAIKALVESKPYLVGKGATKDLKIGAGSSPSGAGDASVPRFKLSQLRDHTFYIQHEKDILKAWQLGLIENDTDQQVQTS